MKEPVFFYSPSLLAITTSVSGPGPLNNSLEHYLYAFSVSLISLLFPSTLTCLHHFLSPPLNLLYLSFVSPSVNRVRFLPSFLLHFFFHLPMSSYLPLLSPAPSAYFPPFSQTFFVILCSWHSKTPHIYFMFSFPALWFKFFFFF